MWCTKCKADVAAMVSPDNERLYCTTCNHELPRPSTGTAKAPGPLTVPAEQLKQMLGLRSVSYEEGTHPLSINDTALVIS